MRAIRPSGPRITESRSRAKGGRAQYRKLIEWFDDDRTELFNLANDPGETTDLAAREPERAAALRDRLRRWQRDVGAVGTAPNPRFDPAGRDGRAE